MPEELPPTTSQEHPAAPRSASKPASTLAAIRRKPRLAIVVGVAILVVLVAVPRVIRAWHSVSTDDAYVNGHVTFVAPRVGGQVARVLVDDNNRVKKGDLLLQLDKEPYQVQLNVAQATVDAAKSEVVTATGQTRSLEGQARSQRFALEHAIEDVQ